MPRTIVLCPFAKINLTLRVGDTRPDGYHDVSTTLQSIVLSDRLTMTARPGPFVLATTAAGVPADRSNLVWRAADAIWRAVGRTGEPSGARVSLHKRIPVAAGLGGGSADAAAALVGFNAIWKARLDAGALSRLAATLGADVPFFLHGGTAEATGRGEMIRPLDDIPRLHVVILMPAFGVSARDAYRWLDDDGGVPRAEPDVDRVDVGSPGGPIALANDLEAPVGRRHTLITEMAAACRRAGALGARMTGSGSAVFGLFSRPPGERVVARLRRGPWRVIVTRTATRREAGRRVTV